MGYGIFGQKVTGIRDIKTPPNGASVHCSFTKKKTGSVFPAFCHATFHHALITCCNESRAGYNPAQMSLTNSRGSRIAGPKSRSRVQCRGRENDLGFEVTAE